MTRGISARKGVEKRRVDDGSTAKVAILGVFDRVANYDIMDLSTGHSGRFAESLHISKRDNPRKNVARSRNVAHTIRALCRVVGPAHLQKLVAAEENADVLSTSRSAQKRENDRKFSHGIDYTRFPRSAQAGAV